MRMTHWFDRIIYILIGLCVLAVMQLPDAQIRLQIIAANMGALFIGIWGGVECHKKINHQSMPDGLCEFCFGYIVHLNWCYSCAVSPL